ncbi:MAG: galactokinase [Pseudomonadota bacterium]
MSVERGHTDESRSATATVPGRVNLIGEHLDYNGGMVLPCALSQVLTIRLTPHEGSQVIVESDHTDEVAYRTIEEAPANHWSDHSVGAIRAARELGLLNSGAKLSIASTVPQGAGLSSSAALIVGVLKASRQLAGNTVLSDVEVAKAARVVENDYIGVPCGIMDQMAVAIAQPGQAIALDTVTLDYDVVELFPEHSFVVVHSGVSRKLTDGRYKTRKLECDEAARELGTDKLCQTPLEIIQETSGLAEHLRRRARHCRTEHTRVIDAVSALQHHMPDDFGSLMTASHRSMRDDFEMSTPEIDRLVDDAVAIGALGARLTGGGFGGCIVALVEEARKKDWLERLLQAHPAARWVSDVRQTPASDPS